MSDETHSELSLDEALGIAEVEPKRRKVAKPVSDVSVAPNVLTPEEEAELEREAAAQFALEQKEAAKKAYLRKRKAELEREIAGKTGDNVKDEKVFVTIDLAEHSAYIMLDGLRFYHGMTYEVSRAQADTIREISSRGHLHQSEIEGKSMREHQAKKRNTTLSGTTGVAVNAPQYQGY